MLRVILLFCATIYLNNRVNGYNIRLNIFSKTKINGGQNTFNRAVIFRDNFNNLNESKWTTQVKIPRAPSSLIYIVNYSRRVLLLELEHDHQFVVYINNPENVGIKNGNLFLKPTLAVDKFGESFINGHVNLGRNCTGNPESECDQKAESFQILPPIISGRVETKNKFSFLYGIVEIRAKLPKGNWIYPELYLQPKTNKYGPNYDSGSIRIAFVPGNQNLNKDLEGGIILGTSNEARTYYMKHCNESDTFWSDNFHKYVVEWTPEKISVGVDGIKYGELLPPNMGYANVATSLKTSAGQKWAEGGPNAPFDQEMYLILGVGVGGHNFFDNIPDRPWNNKSPKSVLQFWTSKDTWYNTWDENSVMLIDYVKVTAL